MRRAVDEKLQSALEKQLKDSFTSLQEQLATVQQAIGQVQTVAGEVGDLKRLFSNVKSRGGWGEAQLEAMLTDILPAGAFEKNFRAKETSTEAVEFALRVPGRGGEHAWLPIDSKFPTEDFTRLVAANEAGLREEESAARTALANRIRLEARRIDSKYIEVPRTLAFGILYVPSDSLFAEIARVPGLIDEVRAKSRVMVMGPSLLPAFLHTLRVSYVTLALEQKASEIGETLGAVKLEWARFGEALSALQKQADTLQKGIGATLLRQRAIGRKLRNVDAIDDVRSDLLLGLDEAGLAEEG
jgi:DNA recombination protein RmuC